MKALNKIFVVLFLAAAVVSCDDDDSGSSTDFETIASTYYEADGDQTIVVPFRNAKGITASDISVDGTATEGEDYEITSITDEGVTIKLFDDPEIEEAPETVRLSFVNGEGNARHIISIVSDDLGILDIDLTWEAGTSAVDMDLLLWIYDEENDEWIDVDQSWGATFEHLQMSWSDDDGLYGLSYNYYSGPANVDNNFTVTFTPNAPVNVEGSFEPVVFNETMTPDNIEPSSDYPVLQTFRKDGYDITEVSEITVPSEGSRIKLLRAKLAEAVAAKYKAAKN